MRISITPAETHDLSPKFLFCLLCKISARRISGDQFRYDFYIQLNLNSIHLSYEKAVLLSHKSSLAYAFAPPSETKNTGNALDEQF